MFRTLLAGTALCCAVSAASAATIYADTVDALKAPVPPGTVVMLKRGSTYQGPITFGSLGTADAPIRVTAYGTGPAPVIKGLPAIYTDAFIVTGSYVEVDSLMFSDTNRGGIQVAKTASHVEITGNEMTRVGEGVDVLGSFVTITHNSIHDLTMVKDTAAPTNDDYGAEGVVIAGSDVEVAFNRIVNARAPSHDYGMDGGAVELFALGAMSGISVHDNWTEGCQGFMEAGGTSNASITDVQVFKNVSLNNFNFLTIHNGGGAFAVQFAALHAFNNTVVDETNGPKERGTIFLDNANAAGIVIDHNIIALNDGDSVFKQTTPGYHHDNLYWLAAKDTHLFNNWTMTLGPGDAFGQPLFVDQVNRNFALLPASPGQGMGAE